MLIVVQGFFHQSTQTISYVVHAVDSRDCIIIDPVLDYDAATARTQTYFADAIVDWVQEHKLRVQWILETHVHADHVSAASYLREVTGGRIAIGEQVVKVQRVFKPLFDLKDSFPCDGSQFDHLLADGEIIHAGAMPIRVMHTPGHTPACVSYLIGDAVFVGDTLFMPDYGSARADFPGGDARQLYQSIQRLFALSDETRMFLCHDYLPTGRSEYRWETTVAEQKAANIHLHGGITENDFVAMREQRDAQLSAPKLLLPSLQLNLRAGRLPEPASNGICYLKLPLNQLDRL